MFNLLLPWIAKHGFNPVTLIAKYSPHIVHMNYCCLWVSRLPFQACVSTRYKFTWQICFHDGFVWLSRGVKITWENFPTFLSLKSMYMIFYIFFWQLLTVALWLDQPMAKLITLLEQHSDRQPPTVVLQATTWWETVFACVKLQECGLGVNLSVKVVA